MPESASQEASTELRIGEGVEVGSGLEAVPPHDAATMATATTIQTVR